MSAVPLDRRLHAIRPDLADNRLRGEVDAPHFVNGVPYRVTVAVCDVKRVPAHDSGLDTQLLLGERVQVFDVADGWAWVQAALDDYVGYVRADHIAPVGDADPDAGGWVTATRTHLFPIPDIKAPAADVVSMGTRISADETVDTGGARFISLRPGGPWVLDTKLGPVDRPAADYVAVAETLTGTPYLWGGRSAFGIDCSGLVQLSMMMAGQRILRDSDMQSETVGTQIDPERLQRGDLVFWNGHVGIMRDGDTLLHANAHTMDTASEPLKDAIGRITPLYGEPTGYRRPDLVS